MAERKSIDFPQETTFELNDNCFTGNPISAQWRRSNVGQFFSRLGIGVTVGGVTTIFSGSISATTGDFSGNVTLSRADDTFIEVNMKANRTTAGVTLGRTRAEWDGLGVAQIAFLTGANIVDKNEGEIAFFTHNGSSLGERMRIAASGAATFSRAATFASGLSGTVVVALDAGTMADGERRTFTATGTVGGANRSSTIGVRKQAGQTNGVSYIQMNTETGANRFFWVDNNGIFRLSASSTDIGTTGGTAVGSQG